MKNRATKNAFILAQTVVFAGIAAFILSALVGWAGINIKASRSAVSRERAIQIAEAGIDYYRWHLAHAPQDFQDGTGGPGPYIHDFFDKDEVLIGSFTLNIIAPAVGSTLVTIESTGKVIEDPTIERRIRTRLAIPSLAKYAFVSASDMRFGQGTEIFGPIHSNGGIRFDGLAHNLITSSRPNYDDPDHSGAVEFGVHTHVNPPPAAGINNNFVPAEAPPTAPVPNRPDIFEAGRQFTVPSVDFVGLTTNLADIKAQAQASGKYFAASGALGYRIVLKNDDTFDLYRVTSLVNPPSNCTNVLNQAGWGSWSVNNSQFLQNHAFPANGLVFVEDHVWVEGAINTARLTIASGRFPDNPATRTSAIINNDITYTNYDGQDVIGIIAQNNVNVGMVSDSDLRIDAALVAQNGRVGRYYYRPNSNWPSSGGQARCSPYHTRNTIELLGMLATNLRYGFAYTDGTGYITRIINYDANLLYNPPPSFPLTSDQYTTISWEEF